MEFAYDKGSNRYTWSILTSGIVLKDSSRARMGPRLAPPAAAIQKAFPFYRLARPGHRPRPELGIPS